MRRLRVAAVITAAVLLLAGCSDIPTSGPVQAGATQEPNGTSINYIPNPPAAGASPRDIVNGFVAAASAGETFAVAKQYLTAGFAASWKPLDRVLVQEAQPTVATNGSNEVSLRVPISAKVGGNGVYTPTSTPQKLDFQLTQVNGQWRIDKADDGIVLTPTAFQKLYRPRALQFFDQTWTRLVPDLRWFFVSSSAAGGTSLPDTRSIVDALIAGPVGAVADGVTVNALKDATVEGLVAGSAATNVTLSVPDSNPSAQLGTRMEQQLIQTLNLPTPDALQLVLNSQVVPVAKALASQAPLPDAYVASGGRFGTLSPTGRFTEDGTLGKRIIAAQPNAITVSLQQGLAAVRTDSQQVAAVTTGATRVVDSRPSLIPPTVDQRGWIYSVPSDSPSGMQASDVKGRTINLFANLPGTSITAIEASPDGTRMLVLIATDAGPQAFVAGITRNADGSPTGLTSAKYPVDLGGNTGIGLGATWVDDGDVAVLVAAPDGSTDRVQVQQLGGSASALGEIPNATSIVGTTNQADLRIRLQNGQLVVSNDQPWHEESTSAPKVSVLAVQR